MGEGLPMRPMMGIDDARTKARRGVIGLSVRSGQRARQARRGFAAVSGALVARHVKAKGLRSAVEERAASR